MGSASKAYLIAYNGLQAVGWGVCLAQVAAALASGAGAVGAYRAGALAAGAISSAPRCARPLDHSQGGDVGRCSAPAARRPAAAPAARAAPPA